MTPRQQTLERAARKLIKLYRGIDAAVTAVERQILQGGRRAGIPDLGRLVYEEPSDLLPLDDDRKHLLCRGRPEPLVLYQSLGARPALSDQVVGKLQEQPRKASAVVKELLGMVEQLLSRVGLLPDEVSYTLAPAHYGEVCEYGFRLWQSFRRDNVAALHFYRHPSSPAWMVWVGEAKRPTGHTRRQYDKDKPRAVAMSRLLSGLRQLLFSATRPS